jgi:hypothetical protein
LDIKKNNIKIKIFNKNDKIKVDIKDINKIDNNNENKFDYSYKLIETLLNSLNSKKIIKLINLHIIIR